MANTRGIFTLIDIQERVFFNNWIPLSDVWIAPSPYYATSPNAGYFGGGGTPSVTAVTDKLNYSSDTTAYTPGANLTVARYFLAATGNQMQSYFGGGGSPGPVSTMDKLTYSSDTTVAAPGSNLITIRYLHAGAGNSTAGYFGGGNTPGGNVATVEKLTYASGSVIYAPTANLSAPRQYFYATGNQTAGYFGGGYNSGYVSIMDKLTYSTDTTVYTPTANLLTPKYLVGAAGNSTNGYFGGGYDGSSFRTTMDKVTFSTDTTVAVPGANLSLERYSVGATGNSTAGYFGGGSNSSGAASRMDKLTYSTDTTAFAPTANLSGIRYSMASSSPKANGIIDAPFIISAPSSPSVRYSDGTVQPPNTGYFGGGAPGPLATMDKVTYASDTGSTVPGAALSAARQYLAATGNSTAGYFGGGTPGPRSTMDKVTYSTDTTAYAPTANLSAPRPGLAATGSSTAGYFGGGGNTSTIDKLTYSTDTTVALTSAYLNSLRDQLTAAGNSTAGYFAGGYTPGNFVTNSIYMLTYATDTSGSGSNLVTRRFGLAATGNSTDGYFGGGYNQAANSYTSVMEKLTYASNTTISIPGANISSPRLYLAATGNSTAGYFGGGTHPDNPQIRSIMDKVTYSTDTITFTPSAANLSSDRSGLAASSSRANGMIIVEPPALTPTSPTSPGLGPTPNNGYWGGGEPGYGSVVMEKVTFPTGTTALIPGANLSVARYFLAAAGNSTNGYFGGGYTYPPSIYLSTMDKLTYSSDTTVYTPTANLSIPRSRLAATGNQTAGYFGGGNYPSVATMDKVIYSTDTTVATPTANLSGTRYDLAATGNQTAGYFGGGFTYPPSAYFSRMDKLTYSSDTTVYTPTANLSIARWGCYATGNSTNGYVSSGLTPSFYSYVTVTDKITYSSDTTAAAPTANFPNFYAYYGAATGNSTSGYFGGSGSNQLDIYRIDYSTDTASSFSSFNSSVGGRRGNLAAAGPRSNGLPEFGINPVPNIV